MSGLIDIHTHAFPDSIAPAAVKSLEESGNVKAYLNGTVDDLLQSMDLAGIHTSVVCSIATRPAQFHPILDWSAAIRSERIIPFPSLHPADPYLHAHLEQIHQMGFKGIKMHPYYQDFFVDDPSLDTLYNEISDLGLPLVMHTGFDIAYPRTRRADSKRILNVIRKFPDLKLITTHLGGWDDWEEVRQHLTGKPVYMELSFALDFLDQIRIRDMLLSHPPEYLLFGSDSPWADQATTLKLLERLDLDDELYAAITGGNAARLLGLE